MLRFPIVARAAQSLSVLAYRLAVRTHRNNVIQGKILRGSAPRALNANPLRALLSREVGFAVLALGWPLFSIAGLAWGQPPQASGIGPYAKPASASLIDISVDSTLSAIPRLSTNDAGYFFAVAELDLKGRSVLVNQAEREGFYSARFSTETFVAPSNIALRAVHIGVANFAFENNAASNLSADDLGATGGVGASARTKLDWGAPALRMPVISWRAVEHCSAVNAFSFLSYTARHESLGEFGGTLGNVAYSAYPDNTEPSRICSLRARDAEGVTTRGCGNNNPPTSARHHSDGEEIVWTAWRHAEADHKQARDNTIDSGMDPLSIQQQEEFTAAQFSWRQAACAVPMSGLDEIKNSGKEKYIDLMEARLTNAERTMKNNISSDFYSAGSLTNQMGGLQLLVSDTPTTGTVGNIDASAQSWWQNICVSANSATATADIGGYMYDLWLQIVRGQDSPNLISSDNVLWKAYNLSLTANQRFTNPELAELGFHNLLFQNAPVVLDGGQGGDCPARHMYFLNTDYLHFCTSKIRNFSSLGGKRFSTNQDASVQLIAWAGNATCSNRSLQGVLKGIT